MTDHATLRSLAEAATPGLGTGDPVVVLFDYEEGGIVREADAAYIAACDPTTVIALLDELETLRAALPAEPWVASDDGERWQPLPEDHQAPDPTPQPAEAVAALVDILRAEFDQGHMMVMEPIAERILALSRHAPDGAVAVTVDDVARRLHEECGCEFSEGMSVCGAEEHDWRHRQCSRNEPDPCPSEGCRPFMGCHPYTGLHGSGAHGYAARRLLGIPEPGGEGDGA